ncbi:MAG: 16S rRNA (cytosine(1402)-N(4))-methyltransferase RsmH [Candidatus Krumholzibacteriia bacterium]
MTAAPHVPVLLQETIDLLQPGPGRRYVDGTFGFGGHSEALLAAGAEVLGLDLDAVACAACARLATDRPQLHCRRASFRDLDRTLAAQGWPAVDGVLLDLGVSSLQLDDARKGFSYRADGPLDLRFDQDQGEPASSLLADLDERHLADLLWSLGEERASRRIARAVVAARAEAPVDTTARLRTVVQSVLHRGAKPEPVLSRVFQALRIAVNDELGALEEALQKLAPALAPGGRFVVIAYHSLEDRLVKRFIDREKRDCICPADVPQCVCGHTRTLRALTKGALTAGTDEAARNPRARSARLRAAERT